MQLTEVKSEKDKHDFLKVPIQLYQNDKNWIRPLDVDIESVFDPKKNKLFRNGEAIRWIMKDENGNLIGRVAAFINNKTAKQNDQPTGGMGFFECINDEKAAHILFNTCKKWLTEKGMEAMDGPINFGDRSQWWGCLVDGFTEPVYGLNYNHAYYKDLFTSYGFKEYFQQYCYSLKVSDHPEENFSNNAKRIEQDSAYRCEHIRKNQLEKYAKDAGIIYNKAWTKHEGSVTSLSYEMILNLFKKIKPVMEEHLMWFVYHNDEPIAFWLNLPDLNQYFKHLNGKLNWWGKLKFFYLKQTGACRKFYGILFGVVPEFQGKGVDAFMILHAGTAIQKDKKYDDMELIWIGDFNPKMIRIAEQLGTKRSRVLITYRKLFDESKPFVRAKIIERTNN